MREELIKLKKDIIDYLKQKEYLKKQRMFFNMKVEEKKQELEEQTVIKSYLDAYFEAKLFEMQHPDIFEYIDLIKDEYPNYESERIKKLLEKKIELQFKEELGELDELDIELAETIAKEYYLYDVCGYQKVKKIEEQLNEKEHQVSISASLILNQPKKDLKKVGTTAINIVNPYKEVAKKQINDAKNISKKTVHKSVKKLRKELKKIEDKTK